MKMLLRILRRSGSKWWHQYLIILIYAKLKFFDGIHDHRIASALAGTFDGFE